VTGATSKAGSTAAPVLDIAVTNNSSREIHHLYISPADRNEWGPDLLDSQIIRPSESATVHVVCPGNEIKLIAEDKTGCFMYQPATCTQGSAEWTITNQTPVDCGTEN
jgi:hypothetical protein